MILSSPSIICNIVYHRKFRSKPNRADFKDDISYNKELNFYTESNFYRCKSGTNIIDYLNRDGAFEDNSTEIDPYTFVDYAGSREGSTGTFTKEKFLNKDDINHLKIKLNNVESTIYSGVLSFSDEGGILASRDKNEAFEIFNNNINSLLKSNGFDVNNIDYYAAFHTNTDHPHIHFSFWEKDRLRIDSYGKKTFNKNKIDLNAIDTFKLSIASYCTKNQTKFELRDAIKFNLKEDLSTDSSLRILSHFAYECKLKSYQYARLSELQKLKLNTLIDNLLIVNKENFSLFEEYVESLDSFQKQRIAMCENLKLNIPESIMKYKSSRLDEFYNRCGNDILKSIKLFRETETQSKEILFDILRESKYNNYKANAKQRISNTAQNNRNLHALFKNLFKNTNLKTIIFKSKEEFEYEKLERGEVLIHG